MVHIITSILTLAVLTGIGMVAKSVSNAGYFWLAFFGLLVLAAVLAWLVWEPADTEDAQERWRAIKARLRFDKAPNDQ